MFMLAYVAVFVCLFVLCCESANVVLPKGDRRSGFLSPPPTHDYSPYVSLDLSHQYLNDKQPTRYTSAMSKIMTSDPNIWWSLLL